MSEDGVGYETGGTGDRTTRFSSDVHHYVNDNFAKEILDSDVQEHYNKSEYADCNRNKTGITIQLPEEEPEPEQDPDEFPVFEDYTAPIETYANGWQMYRDQASGLPYYFNPATQESTWYLPTEHKEHRISEAIPEDAVLTIAEDAPQEQSQTDSCQEYKRMKGYMNCIQSGKSKPIKQVSWNRMYLYLSGGMLSFFNDEAAMKPKSGNQKVSKPEKCLFLQQAIVQLMDKNKENNKVFCNQKDVIQIFGLDGTQYLLMHEDSKVLRDWFDFLKYSVKLLEEKKRALLRSDMFSASETKGLLRKSPSILRSRNLWNSSSSDSSDIKERLMKFFKRRPSRTDLQQRGIYKESGNDGLPSVKDRLSSLLNKRPSQSELEHRGIYKESVFGSQLQSVCSRDGSSVPIFLKVCLQEIEKRGLSEDGIYRKSGSISRIQQLRIHINQQIYDFTNELEIHNLTGIVKLFFRELQEPLIPYDFIDRFIAGYKLPSTQRQQTYIQLIRELPEVNRSTLFELLKHFQRVIEHSSENRMSANNLAIVFGPTLMWTQRNSNIGTMFVLQGHVTENFIEDFDVLFLNTSYT
jgi:hypothetical protein